MSAIFCVLNNLAGTGKTTLSVNMAAAFSLKGKKSLLIDCDPKGGATSLLISKDTSLQKGLPHLVSHEAFGYNPIEECIHPAKDHNGLFCLPNGFERQEFWMHSEIDMACIDSERCRALRSDVRDYCGTNFSVTLTDCPPSLTVSVINSLVISDMAIVPIDAGVEISQGGGLNFILGLIEDIRNEKNPDLKVGFLLTHVDQANPSSLSVCENVREQFPNQVFKSVLPADDAFISAYNACETIFSHNKDSQGAEACRLISEEIELMAEAASWNI